MWGNCQDTVCNECRQLLINDVNDKHLRIPLVLGRLWELFGMALSVPEVLRRSLGVPWRSLWGPWADRRSLGIAVSATNSFIFLNIARLAVLGALPAVHVGRLLR